MKLHFFTREREPQGDSDGLTSPVCVRWTVAGVPHANVTRCSNMGAAVSYAQQMLKAGADSAHIYREAA